MHRLLAAGTGAAIAGVFGAWAVHWLDLVAREWMWAGGAAVGAGAFVLAVSARAVAVVWARSLGLAALACFALPVIASLQAWRGGAAFTPDDMVRRADGRVLATHGLADAATSLYLFVLCGALTVVLLLLAAFAWLRSPRAAAPRRAEPTLD